MKRKGRLSLVLLAIIIVAIFAGDWVLNMPANDTGDTSDWPSKVVGPPCMTIASERHIPADLAEHTCEAIKL